MNDEHDTMKPPAAPGLQVPRSVRMDSTSLRCFAPCPRGLESSLQRELASLGVGAAAVTEGGVGFTGTQDILYRANLESRLASRILQELLHVPYRTEQDLYSAARRIPWDQWFRPSQTIKVKVSAQDCPLKSLDFVTLRVKDAICDAFLAQTGTRPSVDTHRPDLRIDVFLDSTTARFYLDTSGEPLFKRGFRKDSVTAPLRENLAAGLLSLSGWSPSVPFLDPLCGSGTIPLEAAMLAHKMPPGLGRRFAFERFLNFNGSLWSSIVEAARAAQQPGGHALIAASDRDARAIEAALGQAKAAGLEGEIQFTQQDLFDVVPPASPGVMVMNPPYGIRLGTQSELDRFYPKLGSWLKTRCVGWRVYLFTGDLRAPKLIGLAPSKRIPLFNGAIECRLYEFLIVAGGARRKLTAAPNG